MDNDWPDAPDSIGQNDIRVLHVIGEEELTNFTFDGLKRRVGVHSETLSRILYRLEEQGIIQKATSGYDVTTKAKQLLKQHLTYETQPTVTILQTLLSPDIPVQQIVSNLRGKWFGVLRWVGYSQSSDGIALKWITEDGGTQIEATFSEGALGIEAKPLTEKDLNKALRASYQLIGYITKLYSRPTQTRPIAFLTGFDPYHSAS
jgi:DNA-binding MarR family transcriptional regulator